MSTTMLEQYSYGGHIPHRKPLPGANNPQSLATQQHDRTATSSSNAFPQAPNAYPQPASYQQTAIDLQPARRTLSNATASTTSTTASGGAPGPGVALVQTTSALRRSSSSRSGNSPTSYVALMRKQKATVWCDRAQHEDPRLLAQQRAAKMRANAEVVGGNQTGRTATNTSGGIAGGVRSRIRHHGALKASTYAPANHPGGGVPMRLSANEVDDVDSDDGDAQSAGGMYHQQSGSGRSSLASERRVASSTSTHGGRFSAGSTPPIAQGSSTTESMADLEDETPVPGHYRDDYFARPTRTGLSGGSGSSGERENSFGNLGQIPLRQKRDEEERKMTAEDLIRRGSVDERTMTMSGGVRLFVANPDLSD